jgi:hypothetical protein
MLTVRSSFDEYQWLLSVDALKEFLAIPLTNNNMDETLAGWITFKQQQIAEFLGCDIVKQENTIICNGSGSQWLWLPRRPFHSWLEAEAKNCVSMRSTPADPWVAMTDNSDLVMVEDKSRVSVYGVEFERGRQNIKLQFRTGYDEEDMPVTFTEALMKEVSKMYLDSLKGKGRLGMTSQGTNQGGVGTSNSFSNLSDEAKAILKPFVWHTPVTHRYDGTYDT